MTKASELRIRLEIDGDGQFEIDKDGYSDIKSLQDETKQKTDSGEWECYQILVEQRDPDSDTWDAVASLGSSVHDSGYCGTYWAPDEIRNESLRGTVTEVWEQAQAELKAQAEAQEASKPEPRGDGKPLGLALPRSEWNETPGVIGRIEKSGTGNTIIPVGKRLRPSEGSGWEKVAHVALTPEEREILIAELIAQR